MLRKLNFLVITQLIFVLILSGCGASKEEKVDNALKFTQKILWVILVITILVGSGLYYFEKKKEYGSKFKPLKFIFGVKKCRGNTTKSIFF